jgi:DNA-binding PadR family transcriptional regulator
MTIKSPVEKPTLKVKYPPPKKTILAWYREMLRRLESEGLVRIAELEGDLIARPTQAGRRRLKELWSDPDDAEALVSDMIGRLAVAEGLLIEIVESDGRHVFQRTWHRVDPHSLREVDEHEIRLKETQAAPALQQPQAEGKKGKLKIRYPAPPKGITLGETVSVLRALEAEGLVQLLELPDEQFFSWPTEAGRCRLKELWEAPDDVGALIFDWICRIFHGKRVDRGSGRSERRACIPRD